MNRTFGTGLVLGCVLVLVFCSGIVNASLLYEEHFDYTAGSSISPWSGTGATPYSIASGSLEYPTDAKLISSGNSLSRTAAAGTYIHMSTGASIDFDSDGVYYMSFLVNRSATSTSSSYMWLSLRNGATENDTIKAGTGIASGRNVMAGLNSTASGFSIGDPINSLNTTYLFVMRVVTSASVNDTVSLVYYAPSSTIPVETPITWNISSSGAVTGIADYLQISSGTNAAFKVDEILIGTTWADVAVPEPATIGLLCVGGLGLLIRKKQ